MKKTIFAAFAAVAAVTGQAQFTELWHQTYEIPRSMAQFR
jgi:hypothetical protein